MCGHHGTTLFGPVTLSQNGTYLVIGLCSCPPPPRPAVTAAVPSAAVTDQLEDLIDEHEVEAYLTTTSALLRLFSYELVQLTPLVPQKELKKVFQTIIQDALDLVVKDGEVSRPRWGGGRQALCSRVLVRCSWWKPQCAVRQVERITAWPLGLRLVCFDPERTLVSKPSENYHVFFSL